MPARVNSDHLSALGLVSMAGVGLSFWLSGTHPAVGVPLVVVCLVLNWFGDSMDGTLARVRNRQRPRYGFYLDHVIDIAGTAMMLAGLAVSGHMDPLIAAVTLAAWLMVMGESFLATSARSLFRMSFLWFGPTELRILIAIGALMLLGGGLVRPFGWGRTGCSTSAACARQPAWWWCSSSTPSGTRSLCIVRRHAGPSRLPVPHARRRSSPSSASSATACRPPCCGCSSAGSGWRSCRRRSWPPRPPCSTISSGTCGGPGPTGRPGRGPAAGRLLRFNLSNGGFSLVGGAAIMALLVDALGVHYLLANLAAVLVVSIVNFLASDRFVFTRAGAGRRRRPRAHTTYKTTAM